MAQHAQGMPQPTPYPDPHPDPDPDPHPDPYPGPGHAGLDGAARPWHARAGSACTAPRAQLASAARHRAPAGVRLA